MDSHALIDAQFDRAVEIVQNLPKTGPIQTDYEEKLLMYSLYKQATVGNVQGPRPSVWEMLARAKWDAWAKHKDLEQYEAKWLYVDALLKVLRRYSDKTVAMDLVRELESYSGDASNLVMSEMPAHLRNNATNPMFGQNFTPEPRSVSADKPTSESEVEEEEEQQPLPPIPYPRTHTGRPQSSMSSHRYRTPMASMLMSPPPIAMSVPPTQPRPLVETTSVYEERNVNAFEERNATQISTYQTGATSFSGGFVQPGSVPPATRNNPYIQPPYHSASQLPFPVAQQQQPQRQLAQTSWPALERAISNIQAHLAALTERIDILETMRRRSNSSLVSPGASHSPGRGFGRGSGSPTGPDAWDIDDMGMWSLVLHPISRLQVRFRRFMDFIMYNDNRSPTLVVVRRLFLDISFLLCLLAVVKMVWRRSGVRRREILGALSTLWCVVVGRKKPRRIMVDRAVQ
ncbi:hypothetical protein EIP86_011364 [Pleurotus ostreatoroseus]|nr:hypothetical protein EIP86_011364 [Pleurotus ostreatoroseus]